MTDLFATRKDDERRSHAPLADRMRPQVLDEVMGQEKLVGEGTLLRQALDRGTVPSLILWGPPGTGKTTVAMILAHQTDAEFAVLHAVTSGVRELRAVVSAADERLRLYGRKTVLFVDEIHRWSKSQQDALLPHVEQGTLTLIGATTENPSLEVVAPLLSRCRVLTLEPLSVQAVGGLVTRALADRERGLGELSLRLAKPTIAFLAVAAHGDARVALNALEYAATAAQQRKNNEITKADIIAALATGSVRYDKGGEEHYNIISALHKSLRGSDPSASIYWLARMLEAGEDPLYVARRLIRFAAEDIGVADPQALTIALAGYDAAHRIGMPECDVALAEVVLYLARAEKSNEAYVAYGKAKKDAREYGPLPVPLHLRNAPTKLMRDLKYGEGYQYNPDFEGEDIDQQYLPGELKEKDYFIN